MCDKLQKQKVEIQDFHIGSSGFFEISEAGPSLDTRPSIKRGLPAKLISGAEDSKKCLDAWQAVEAVVTAALGGASLPPLGQPKA